MAHDKSALHVSHYNSSVNWRSSVAPEDRSWILFVDIDGNPHLFCDVPTLGAGGEVVHSYEPAGSRLTAIEGTMVPPEERHA